MSTWVDVSIYIASNIVLWIKLPLAYRQLAVPALVDRNADWVAANPAAVQRMARSVWFTNSCIAWGVFSILVLLLTQFGVGPHALNGLLSGDLAWQRLNSINNTLCMAGFLGFGTIVFVAQRSISRIVPPGVRRSASLLPRSAADSIPLPWRIATEALTVIHLLAWVVIGSLGLDTSPKHWGSFTFLLFMSVVFAVMAVGSARRPPSFMDRVFGAAYRHREVRIIYGARWGIVAFGIIALASGVRGSDALLVDPVRLSFLLFQCLFIACLLAFVLIKPVDAETSHRPQLNSSKSEIA